MKKLICYSIMLLFGLSLCAQSMTLDEEMEVSLRIIGHNILKNGNDSTSRVLPIEKMGDFYTLRFENPFGFEPSQLVATINEEFKKKDLANAYLTTVTTCDSNKVVYSYVMQNILNSDVLHCAERREIKSCYNVNIKIIEHEKPLAGVSGLGNLTLILQIGGAILLLGLMLYIWTWQKFMKNEDYKISLGNFTFDTRNMLLSSKNNRIELTPKESELLEALHSRKNETVERDTLLQEVWGDEGDYIGRTLDVFISKLRKHLESDNSIKIVNIRGVGYKLVVG